MAELRKNKAKQTLDEGGIATAAMGNMSGDIIEFLGPFGFDAMWIEAEHGPFDFQDIPEPHAGLRPLGDDLRRQDSSQSAGTHLPDARSGRPGHRRPAREHGRGGAERRRRRQVPPDRKARHGNESPGNRRRRASTPRPTTRPCSSSSSRTSSPSKTSRRSSRSTASTCSS